MTLAVVASFGCGGGKAVGQPGGAGVGPGGAGGGQPGGTGGGQPGGTGGGGATPTGGAGGTQPTTPEVCRFEIDAALSPAIPTVGIVNWSIDLAGIDSARIEFTVDDPTPDTINRGSGGPIDVTGTLHRALMLGLKPERTYTYRIVATGGGKVCTSPPRTLTTGAATGAPTITRTVMDAAAQARGFIIATNGDPQTVSIIDADGVVVWWAAAPRACSRALMDWAGANMWMLAAAPTGGPGEMRRIGMDGLNAENDVPGLASAHHDFAVLPGGGLATLFWVAGDNTGKSDLVERSADGTIKAVVRLDAAIYPGATRFHANSLMYHPADDSYTVSDLTSTIYTKLTRQGQVVWQLGTDCARAMTPKCASHDKAWGHGHHQLANGNFLLFNNEDGFVRSAAYEFSLTETPTSLAAQLVWSYTPPRPATLIFGDVQRLPNGNTLVVFSRMGIMHEVSPSGALVHAITSNVAGYANVRETLYGPPLR
jgi:hypothetical protein